MRSERWPAARTIPVWYFDAEIYSSSRAVFGGAWHYAAADGAGREPGSFVTIEIAGEPIVVVRGDDGVLRAFHNVCRHRAAQIINQPEGQVTKRAAVITATYDLAGRPRGVPEFDGRGLLPRRAGLAAGRGGQHGPFVFVHQGTPHQTPRLPRAVPRADRRPRHRALRFAGRKTYELDCNWKVFVDNYQDGGYHVNTVHPGLGYGALDYAHYRTENCRWRACSRA